MLEESRGHVGLLGLVDVGQDVFEEVVEHEEVVALAAAVGVAAEVVDGGVLVRVLPAPRELVEVPIAAGSARALGAGAEDDEPLIALDYLAQRRPRLARAVGGDVATEAAAVEGGGGVGGADVALEDDGDDLGRVG